jgi:hypothetical protein
MLRLCHKKMEQHIFSFFDQFSCFLFLVYICVKQLFGRKFRFLENKSQGTFGPVSPPGIGFASDVKHDRGNAVTRRRKRVGGVSYLHDV